MYKHLAVAAACAGLFACGGKEPAPETAQQPEAPAPSGAISVAHRQVVSVSEMQAGSPDGQVVVDMRNTDLGFRVEAGVNYSGITVICPSSRVMNMEQWLPELASNAQRSVSDMKKGFTMYPFMAPEKGTVSQQAAPVCIGVDGSSCGAEREPDGSWTCLC